MSAFRSPITRALAALLVAAALSGCGFKLRGTDGSYNLPFHSIYVGIPDTSPLGTELRRNLRAGDAVVVVESPAEAQAQIDLVSETRGRAILSLNSLGRVREFLLTYTVVFQVRDPKGGTLLAPTEIILRRNMAFDETQVLAKEAEANLLYRDMQGDAVQQMIRRVAALKPPAA
jgi:LPS-assembly lipoprotein